MSKYVMGISYKHDASAALVKDGKLVAFAEEERFTRVKHQAGIPVKAINFCLKTAGITFQDLDKFVISQNPPMASAASYLDYYFAKGLILDDSWGMRKASLQNFAKFLLNPHLIKNVRSSFPLQKEQLAYLEHHYSHAYSVYPFSGFNDSAVLTVDGWGDFTTAMKSHGKGKKIKEMWRKRGNNSLGLMYNTFSKFLGYPKGDGHEGKVMGLAAYGKPNIDFSDILTYGNGDFNVNTKYCYGKQGRLNTLKKFGEPIKDIFEKTSKITQKQKDIAASLQYHLEEAMKTLAFDTLEKTGSKNLSIAGGVGLSCKTNGEIKRDSRFKGKELCVTPLAGDTGKSLGAAEYWALQLGGKPHGELEHAYYGPEFSNEQILEELKKDDKLKYDYIDDISGEAAEKISKGKIVAWFQGKMEMGPRALGNRSILALPSTIKMRDKINSEIKFREWWRPLAPSVVEKSAKEWFEGCKKSRFMIIAHWVPEEKRKEVAAIVHVDGSARPQTVSKDTNPKYFRLLKEMEKHTGLPMVLNTSFNSNEPIICAPSEALKTFSKLPLDYLAMGNYLVRKR